MTNPSLETFEAFKKCWDEIHDWNFNEDHGIYEKHALKFFTAGYDALSARVTEYEVRLRELEGKCQRLSEGEARLSVLLNERASELVVSEQRAAELEAKQTDLVRAGVDYANLENIGQVYVHATDEAIAAIVTQVTKDKQQ